MIPFAHEKVHKIIVIGDIHGDLDRLLDILVNKLKIINKKIEWIAQPKNTVIVQMGDQLDGCRNDCSINNGTDDINVLKLMTYLHTIACKHGGAVYSLLGNHELMNVAGNHQFVSNQSKQVRIYKSWSGLDDTFISRHDAFKQGGVLSSFMAHTRTSAIMIGSWIFVHGGIDKESESLENTNKIIHDWLLGLSSDESIINEIMHDNKKSIFWNRSLGTIQKNLSMDDDSCINYYNPLLKLYPGKKIVVGHTIQKNGITHTCDKNIYRVDTAISKGFDIKKKNQIMEIINDTEVNIINV